MSWAMHAHIAHRFSNGTIQDLFREFFGEFRLLSGCKDLGGERADRGFRRKA